MLRTVAVLTVTICVVIFAVDITPVDGTPCAGCVELDEATFDKVVGRFSAVLVKFDIAYPYGDKHEQFAKFAQETAAQNDDFLVAAVGIKDYGDKENSKLAERFNVDDEYPVIKLFRNGVTSEWVDYPEDAEVSVDKLRQFVRQHSNVYMVLNGCLQSFDKLATKFIDTATRLTPQSKEVDDLVNDAEQQAAALDNEQSKATAKIYVLLMKRVRDRGLEFIPAERKRLHQLLTGKISASKKDEINQKLNILAAFKRDDETNVRSEL